MHPFWFQVIAVNVPHHWKSNGAAKELIQLGDSDEDAKCVRDYLLKTLPQATQVQVWRSENAQLWGRYSLRRDKVRAKNGDPNEQWLWHGARDCWQSVVEDGHNTAYASLYFNAYGVGNYFAPDAKLSNHFIKPEPAPSFLGWLTGHTRKFLILSRVCCGRVGPRPALKKYLGNGLLDNEWVQQQLRKTQNRLPPENCDSSTSQDSPGREIVVHENDEAFPAYVVSYALSSDLPNPYTQPNNYMKHLKHSDTNHKLSPFKP